jgi:hypothetical protein
MTRFQKTYDITQTQLAITKAIMNGDMRGEKVLLTVLDEELNRSKYEDDIEFERRMNHVAFAQQMTPEQERDRWRACLSASLTR